MRFSHAIRAALLASALTGGGAGAQQPARADSADTANAEARAKRPRRPSPLFASTAPLELTMTLNVRRIINDRDTTKRGEHPLRPVTITYTDSAGSQVTVAGQVRVRGIWRLHHCQFPPLRLRLTKEAADKTIFDRERRPKIVPHCRNTDEYEQYVLHEYAIYRMHALVTPIALKSRLARITYVDSATAKPAATRAAILLEDEDNLAERLGGEVLEIKGVPAHQLEPYDTFVMSLFQFMIGNTDWSVPGLHNITLIKADSALFPRHYGLAYDWDFTGLIRTRYSAPDQRLRIRNVRDRLYRGVCPTDADLARAVATFNERRAAILAVYDEVPGLDPRIARDGKAYIEEFFQIINDPRRLRRDVVSECDRAR